MVRFGCTVVAALLLLAGCAADGERNYQLLEEDRDIFDAEVSPPLSEIGAPSEVPDPPPPPEVVVIETDEPSVTDLAREDWELVAVAPVDARVTHWPAYYDVIRRRDWIDVLEPDDVETRLALAMSGAWDETWSAGEAVAAVAEPAEFYLNTALLPFYMVVRPPWSEVVWP